MKQELSNVSSKLDRLEGHSRRNNLRFLGVEGRVSESWEETEQKVRHFISNTLGLTDMHDVEIERAHRVGSQRLDNCPIIAKFSRYKDRETILKTARQTLTAQSQFSVREDFTERVQLHRRQLSHKLVTARNEGKFASLRFDKLVIDGDVYKFNEVTQSVERIGNSRVHSADRHQQIPPPNNSRRIRGARQYGQSRNADRQQCGQHESGRVDRNIYRDHGAEGNNRQSGQHESGRVDSNISRDHGADGDSQSETDFLLEGDATGVD